MNAPPNHGSPRPTAETERLTPSPFFSQWTAAALGGVLLLFAAHAAYFWPYTNDDAYIAFRYARNFADGRGLCFNPGERVEGFSSPLFVFFSAIVYRLAGADAVPTAAKLCGVCCGLLTVLVTFCLARDVLRSLRLAPSPTLIWSPAAAALLAAAPSFAANSPSGLETTCFALLVTLAVWTGLKGLSSPRGCASGLFWGLAFLTRPEAPALAAVFWALILFSLFRSPNVSSSSLVRNLRNFARQPAARFVFFNCLLACVPLAGYVAFRCVYYGEWLPNTYYAKIGGHGIARWWYIAQALLPPVLGLPGLAAALAGWGLALRRPEGRAARLLPALVAIFAMLPLLTGTDWMPGFRLLVFNLPLLAVGASAGWALGLQRLGQIRPTIQALLAASLVAAAWARQDPYRRELLEAIWLRHTGYQTGHEALARWLQRHAPRDAKVALMHIGLVGYRCPDLGILDITGLTDRYIAKSPGRFLHKRYDPAYVLDRKPDFIVLVAWREGASYTPPPEGAPFYFYFETDEALYKHPLFQFHYCHPRPYDPNLPWYHRLACEIGAEAVFEHGHPGRYYMLALFRRSAAADG